MSRLDEAGRMLDGPDTSDSVLDSIKSGLSSLVDKAESLASGVTKEDVANGFDPETLSREDKVALFVDGEVPGAFSRNPWHVGLDLNESVGDFSHAHGGVVLVIQCDAQSIDALESKVLATRFAFMWDDEVSAESGVLNLEVTSKTFLVAQLKDLPLGKRLTLWSTDGSIVFTLIQQAPPSEADAIRKQVFGAVGASADSTLDKFLAGFQSFVDVQAFGAIALLAVGGLALYFLLNTKGGAAAASSLASGV